MRIDEFYDPENDRSSRRDADDTRSPLLTLERLNKLRKYRELRKAEMAERKDFVPAMYRSQSGGAGGGLM